MPRRLFRKPSKQSRNYSSRVSNGPIHAPNRIPRFLRIPDLPLERGFIPTVAFGTHRNGRNRDSFAFRTAVRLAISLTAASRGVSGCTTATSLVMISAAVTPASSSIGSLRLPARQGRFPRQAAIASSFVLPAVDAGQRRNRKNRDRGRPLRIQTYTA